MDQNDKKNSADSVGEDVEIVEEEGSDAATQKIERYKKELESCRKEKAEYLDGWQRAKADFINYKKDEVKRFEDMARFGVEDMVYDILPILDNFQLALSQELPPQTEKGILMIKSQIEDMLKKRGVAAIDAKAGEPFDPSRHESIGEKASDFPEGVIAEGVQRGYMMHGKVIRAARVRLSKSKQN